MSKIAKTSDFAEEEEPACIGIYSKNKDINSQSQKFLVTNCGCGWQEFFVAKT
jgi:predicted nucleic-acid-binding Zn-ribbon protein